MPSELYRTYEVLIEESVHPEHPKRKKTGKPCAWGDGKTYAALRDTNAIFQDAVCYYTILLAGLAGEAKANGKLLNPLWAELCQREKLPNNDVARVLQRLAKNYTKLAGIKSLADFCDCVFISESSSEAKVKMQAWRVDTYRIIEQQGAERDEQEQPTKCKDMTQFAASWASILCDATGETEIPGNGVFDRIHRELLAEKNRTAETVLKQIENALVRAAKTHRADFERLFKDELLKCDTEPKRKRKQARKAKEYLRFLRKRRKNAQDNLVSAFEKGLFGKAKKLEITSEQHHRHNEAFVQLAATIGTLPNCERRFKRLRYGERDNSFEAVILRFLWLKDRAGLKELALADLEAYLNDSTKQPEQPPMLNGIEVSRMPYWQPDNDDSTGVEQSETKHRKIIFPLFVTPIAGVSNAGRSAWWEFDASAFATAAEDVFKYKIRSLERERKVNKLRAIQNAFEGTGETLKSENSPSGKEMKILGMKDDPRWKGDTASGKRGIVDLLSELRADMICRASRNIKRITIVLLSKHSANLLFQKHRARKVKKNTPTIAGCAMR